MSLEQKILINQFISEFGFDPFAQQDAQAVPPANCRQRLKLEGKAYPRSGCAVCGPLSPHQKKCDAMLNAAPTPPAQGMPVVCQGANCGAADGQDHSPECIVETAEAQGWGDAPEVVAARQLLNAAPTPPQQRVTLTDDEIERLRVDQEFTEWRISEDLFLLVARAVIEAYEIKNGLKP